MKKQFVCVLGALALLQIVTAIGAESPGVRVTPPFGSPPGVTTRYSVTSRPQVADFYPPVSVKLQEEGRPIVRICWDVTGKVTEATLAESGGTERLDDAAIKYGRQIRMKPATRNGVSESGCANQPVAFSKYDQWFVQIRKSLQQEEFPDLAKELGLDKAEERKFFDLLAEEGADIVGAGGIRGYVTSADGIHMDLHAIDRTGQEKPGADSELKAKVLANEIKLNAILASKSRKWKEYLKTLDARRESQWQPITQLPANYALTAHYMQVEEVAARAVRAAALRPLIAGIVEEIKAQMVDIPAGTFQMGSKSDDADTNEQPVHAVTLRAFRLAKFEVTMAQYEVFAEVTGRGLPNDEGWGRGNRPAINVSWDDAQAFAAWLSQQTGLKFRLPSEAEWEYAARAGTTTEYPWGNSYDAAQANAGVGKGGKTATVGSYPANRFGIFDMIGNVWEWTADCPHMSYSGAPRDGSAWTAGECNLRVIRGGSWGLALASVSTRFVGSTGYRSNDIGFRLAQDF